MTKIAFYKELGKTLYDVLTEIYERYGFYQEELVSMTLAGQAEREDVVSSFRERSPTQVAVLIL